MNRGSGVVLHITSLPSDFGLGCFSHHAYRFIRFLHESGCSYWQVLPFTHCPYAQSPYSGFSAFAGNPYFISLQEFFTDAELHSMGFEFEQPVLNVQAFEQLYDHALHLVYQAQIAKTDLSHFKQKNAYWIDSYAQFMAIKNVYHANGFNDFPTALKTKQADALKSFTMQQADEINYHIFLQYLFDKQWNDLKNYAHQNGIQIIGDMPMYVMPFSSDVWAHPEWFAVDEQLNPTLIAGTPPDYFNSQGQCWDNPTYRYNEMEKDGFSWWRNRLKQQQHYFDAVKLDHFRGFAAFWGITPKSSPGTGSWIPAPGEKLVVKFVQGATQSLIAEDLGVITPDVETLLEKFNFPRMNVLQFAFDSDENNPYLPHRLKPNSVSYLGTHDNDTTLGFLTHCPSPKRERILRYFHLPDTSTNEEVLHVLLTGLFSSDSDVVLVTMQDLLGQHSDARMNIPGVIMNWIYQIKPSDLSQPLSKQLNALNHTFKR